MFSGNLTSLYMFLPASCFRSLGPSLREKSLDTSSATTSLYCSSFLEKSWRPVKTSSKSSSLRFGNRLLKCTVKTQGAMHVTYFPLPHSCIDGKWVVQKYGSYIWSFEVGKNVENTHPNTVGQDQAAVGYLHVHILWFQRN